MRILLIEPSVYTKNGLRKGELYKDSMRSTRVLGLTLPYLAGLTPRNHQVDIAFEVCEDIVHDYNLEQYDIIGITAQTVQVRRTLELARIFRKMGKDVVIGGPATIEENHRLVPILSRFSTSIVVGEAELLWEKLLQDYENGNPTKIYQSDVVASLENLPLPRFDLVNFSKIQEPHVLPAMTSRGCPRICTFCSEFLYSGWRLRPVNEVVDELARYKSEFGISRIVFRDDDFMVHPRRTSDLLQRMLPLGLEWACQTDLNLARHPELAELAIKAGWKSVSFGLESILSENRDSARKSFFTLPEAETLLALLHDNGVETQVNVIFGFDHDTIDVFDATVDFLLDNRVSSFFASILFPIPGTTIYNQLLAENRLINTSPPGIDDPTYVGYKPKRMTAQQLVDGFIHAQTRFYSERGSDCVFWLGPDKHIWTGAEDLVLK